MLKNVKPLMLAVLAAAVGSIVAAGKLGFFEQPAIGYEAAAPAKITVVAPADATISFDGEPTSETGTERLFVSPPLPGGKQFSYEIVARWRVEGKAVEKTRRVAVTSGGNVRVDFLGDEWARGRFSFAVYGDSRSMMYLPYKLEQKEEAIKLMTDMFELVLPEKVAAEVVKKDVKLTYDPATGELVQIVMPFMTRSEVSTLSLDKGWVTEASVEDVKLLPGVRRTMFRLEGGEWVARGIVNDVQSGRAKFILNTGDMVWWGKQGPTPAENPYWRLVYDDVLKQLPAPDDQMRAAGLPGRVFPAVGNHEVWDDSDVQGLLNAFPYLKQFGVSDKRLIYKFDFNGSRFIFLWTGKYDYREPTAWGATRPAFEAQMKEMQQWLEEARAAGTRKIFIAFHAPAFCRSGMGPIPEAQNPHKFIAPYAKDLDIVVFNGHVHTTELYEVDGVKYLLLGGGGAEQDPILPGRTHIKVPEGYPPDLYWKGKSPKEEYNYLLVDVEPGENTKFTLNRFRPWSSKPFETVELFGSSR